MLKLFKSCIYNFNLCVCDTDVLNLKFDSKPDIRRVKVKELSSTRFEDARANMEYFGQSSISLSAYRDQKFKGTKTEQERLLAQSSTLYIGNLSFYTTEEQIHELFSRAGDVKRIIMGLDRNKKTPCGFCFVEYYTRADGENAMRYINGTRLDDRLIRTDWDAGFIEGRQYGRGKAGGQVKYDLIKRYMCTI